MKPDCCEGNCGTMFDTDASWKVLAPDVDGREFEFCSLDCMASWLDAERP